MNALSRFQPVLLSVLRIVTSYLFLLHGTTKLLGLPHIAKYDHLQILSLSGIAGVFELICGTLLLLGLFTRPLAFLMSGMMAIAYFVAHSDPFLLPILNGGELAALYCFVFLYLSAAGAGPWSLDRILRKAD